MIVIIIYLDSDEFAGDTDDLPNGFVEGLKKCQWNGRCQLLPVEGHNIKLFLDGAHTGESIEICKDWYLKSSASESSNPLKVLIFNCSSTRNPEVST
jgi:folylpolyglutamate synthase